MPTYQWRSSYSSYRPGFFMTKTVKILIIINVAVFLFINLFKAYSLIYIFGMVPSLVFSKFMIWQLATYMFIHVGLFHLIFNMLMLWFFGPAIEQAWGPKKFLFFYFFTGIGAALCSFIFSYNSYIIGASGAILGILIAYMVMFPETTVLIFFIFPMNIKYAVLLIAVVELWLASQGVETGIAHFAHLGGMLFGYLYLKSEWIKRQVFRLKIRGVKDWHKKRNSSKAEFNQEKFNQEIDLILDKISKHGMKSLTPRERKLLDKKSKMGN